MGFGQRTFERQSPGAELQVYPIESATAVESVTHDRVAGASQMLANLMFTSCFYAHLYQ